MNVIQMNENKHAWFNSLQLCFVVWHKIFIVYIKNVLSYSCCQLTCRKSQHTFYTLLIIMWIYYYNSKSCKQCKIRINTVLFQTKFSIIFAFRLFGFVLVCTFFYGIYYIYYFYIGILNLFIVKMNQNQMFASYY